MDEPATPERTAERRRLVAFVLLLAVLAAVVAVPLALGGDDEASLRPLGLTPGGRDQVGLAGAEADAMMPYQKITYVLDGELPDLGDEGPVWELQRPAMDAARAAELAAALGATGGATAQDGGWVIEGDDLAVQISPTSGAWMVSAYRTYYGDVATSDSGGGSVGSTEPDVGICVVPEPGTEPNACNDVGEEPMPPDCVTTLEEGSASTGECTYPGVPVPPDCVEAQDPDGMATKECTFPGGEGPIPPETIDPMPPPAPEDVPDAAEAERIALDLLRSAGVLPEQYEVEVTDSGMVGFATACLEGTDCDEPVGEEYVTSRMVTVTTEVGGQRVEGLSWTVEVGERSEIQGVWGMYADLEEVGSYPLRPIDAAYAAMVAGESPYDGGPMPLGGVYLEDGGVKPEVMVGTFVGSGSPISPECPVDDSGSDCAVAIDPACPVDGCSVPGDDGVIMCVTTPCPGGDDPLPPVDDPCSIGSDVALICKSLEEQCVDYECGLPVPEPEPPTGCIVQPDGTELCEAPVPGEPPSDCKVQPEGTEYCAPPTPTDPPVCTMVEPGLDAETEYCDPTVCFSDDPGLRPEPVPGDEGSVEGSGGGGHGEEDPSTAVEPDIAPADVCEVPIEPPFEPEPVVITVTGATLGAMVVPAVAADGSDTAYVVPAYVFAGTWADGSPWSQPLVAVDDEWIATPVTTTIVPPDCAVQPDGSEICEEPTTTTVSTDTTEGPAPSTTVVGPPCVVQPDGSEICEEPPTDTTVVDPGPTTTWISGCVVQPDGSEICEIPSTTVP